MKKQLLGLFLCAGAFVSYGQDTTGQQNQNMTAQDAGIKCAALDASTLACFSPEVDTDKDNYVSEEEWTSADPAQVGIIDISNVVAAPDTAASQSMSADTTASGSQLDMGGESEIEDNGKKSKKDKNKKNKKKDNTTRQSEGLDDSEASGDARFEENTDTEGSGNF